MATAPPVAIPSPAPSTNTSPQPQAPDNTTSSNAVAASDNIAKCPGTFSFHAPEGWKLASFGGVSVSASDIVGNDCIAMISGFIEQNDAPLRKYAQDRLDSEKGIYTTMNSQEDVQYGDLQPFTTDSGSEGLKCVETHMKNGVVVRKDMYYFFEGHADTKILISTICHMDQLDHDAPLFDDVVRTLVRE
jgi:hypothetical protein